MQNLIIQPEDSFKEVFHFLNMYDYQGELSIKLECNGIQPSGHCLYLGQSNNYFVFENYLNKNSRVKIKAEAFLVTLSEEEQISNHLYEQHFILANSLLNHFDNSLIVSAGYKEFSPYIDRQNFSLYQLINQNSAKKSFLNVIIKNITEAKLLVYLAKQRLMNENIVLNLSCLENEELAPCASLGKSENYILLNSSNLDLISTYIVDSYITISQIK